jgi:2-C-methyl-D-erythritol 4-phosphate cytidylyltransferase
VRSGVAAVVPAAGSGSRLVSPDAVDPKAFRRLNGRQILQLSLRALEPFVDQVVVAVPPAYVDAVGSGRPNPVPLTVVAGGSTRQQSVRNALSVVDPAIEYVLVHDAARPLVPMDVFTRVIDALHGGAEAVVPVVPVVDSLRQLQSGGDNSAFDRSSMRAVQTPQGFRRSVLDEAHRGVDDFDAADDAILVEGLGVPMSLVAGSDLAFKITRPLDLILAEALLTRGNAIP